MDNISVISISDSSSRHSIDTLNPLQCDNEEISNGFHIREVSKENLERIGSNDTPNPSQKVTDWMETCKSPHPPEDGQLKSTCIRYDFDKGPKAQVVPKSCFTRTTPLFSYMEEAKKKFECHKVNGSSIVTNRENCFTPMSPESHKKELCNYLQLMKPEEKPQIFSVENRRSGRFKTQKKKDECLQPENHSTVSFGEIKNILSLKKKSTDCKLLPLPPESVYTEVTDFEDSIKELVKEQSRTIGCLGKVKKKQKFKFSLKFHKKLKRGFLISKRCNLRSGGRLRNISLDTLILRKSHLRKKRRKLLRKFTQKTLEQDEQKNPKCETVPVQPNSNDENVDLKNFVDDMLQLDKMSEEHRKCVIESRILASSSINNLISKRGTQEADVQKAYKIFHDLSNERQNLEEKENTHENPKCDYDEFNGDIKRDADSNLALDIIYADHDYTSLNGNESEEDENSVEDGESLSPVPIPNLEVLPVNTEIQTKSLHSSLTLTNRRRLFYGLHNWNSGCTSNQKSNHLISIAKKNGSFLRAFYQDYNLVIVQENMISFWMQSALGNILGAQNMWIPKGEIPRICLNSSYAQKNATEMVISTETSLAFVELWTKEHKSELREVPLADVFATVYFWRVRQNGLEKKALQLENIQGFADDVQYCVLKCYPRIVVSWHALGGEDKKTKIHSYHLAADFQTVASISEIQPVQHYVSSLHNVEDCDSLVMGCGENKVTLWNVEYGYIVATIDMLDIKSPLATLWVKCDRGFLFTIQKCVDQELRLIAINGMNHSWKKLQSYSPIQGFDNLKGVCIDNGILIAYYSQGILCWNAQTGELIVEEVPNEYEYIPSGKNVIMIVDENVIVRHSLSHLITDL